MTRPDQASAPEQGVALTEGEKRTLRDPALWSQSADLFAAVEQIIRDRTPGIQAAALEAAARDFPGPHSREDVSNAGDARRWLRARAQQVRDSATGGGA